ncbi:unnamed protein product, partial [Phaeothamnion confervicola]
MAAQVQSALRAEGFETIVAPYEADAQVAYLCKIGLASAIITEDSDILVYLMAAGIAADVTVLYKLDRYGNARALRLDCSKGPTTTLAAAIEACPRSKPAGGGSDDDGRGSDSSKSGSGSGSEDNVRLRGGGGGSSRSRGNSGVRRDGGDGGSRNSGTRGKSRLSGSSGRGRGRGGGGRDGNGKSGRKAAIGLLDKLHHFGGPGGGRRFVQMCVLSGCDYLSNVKSVGPVRAADSVIRYASDPAETRIESIVETWTREGRPAPPGFVESAARAEASFFFHHVFDPRERRCVHFCEPGGNSGGGGGDGDGRGDDSDGDGTVIYQEDDDFAEAPDFAALGDPSLFLGDSIGAEDALRVASGVLDPVTLEPVEVAVIGRAAAAAPGRRQRAQATIGAVATAGGAGRWGVTRHNSGNGGGGNSG